MTAMDDPDLDRYAIRSYEDVAAAIGVSKQRVQQIERKAFEKLFRNSRLNKIRKERLVK